MTSLPDIAAALRAERYSHHRLSDGSGVLLDLQGTEVLALNETSETLLTTIESGAVSTAELVARLVARFEVEAEEAARDVETFVSELSECLIEKAEMSD